MVNSTIVRVMTMFETSQLKEVQVAIRRSHLKSSNSEVLPLDRKFGDPDTISEIIHLTGVHGKIFHSVVPNQVALLPSEVAVSVRSEVSVPSGSSGDKSRRSRSRGRSESHSSEEEFRRRRSRRRDKYRRDDDEKAKRHSRAGHRNKESPARSDKNKREESRSSSSSDYSTSRSSSPPYSSSRYSKDRSSRDKRKHSRKESRQRLPDAYPAPAEFSFGMSFDPDHVQPPPLRSDLLHYAHPSHLPYYPLRMQAPYRPPRFFGESMYYRPRRPLPVYNNRPIPKFVVVTVTACTTTNTNTTAVSSMVCTSVVPSTTGLNNCVTNSSFRNLDSSPDNKADPTSDTSLMYLKCTQTVTYIKRN